MAQAIYLPKVGMTMEEATLTRWSQPDGATITRGQVIFEMETEKVQMEIEAEADGMLKHLVAEGTRLKPGDVVGGILATGEEVPQDLLDRVTTQAGNVPALSQSEAATAEATRPEAEPPTVTAASATPGAPADPGAPVRVSPIARRLADQHGIDVHTLTGSGPDGRIVERDVQRAIEAKTTRTETPAGDSSTAPISPPSATEAPSPADGAIAYTGRRRTIGERMHESLASMAQLTLSSETYVDEATKMLHGLNREWRSDGVTVTLTGLIVRACALALRDHPQLNARIEGDRIVLEPAIHIGVAVAQEAGLMVPVVRDAGRLSLKEVAAALQAQREKAREERLGIEDVTGGTFTVTSLEGTVVDAFTPIINPPQAAILGIGRVRDVVGFEGATPVKRQATTLSLTFDHRVTDGTPAARFLGRIAELLERPYVLM